jgi:hypothetical protein
VPANQDRVSPTTDSPTDEEYESPIVEPVDSVVALETIQSEVKEVDSEKPDENAMSPSPVPPPLPARKKEPPALPPRKRAPFFWLRGRSQSSVTSEPEKPKWSILSSPEYDLVLQRLDANNEGFLAREGREKDASLSGIKELQQTFENVRQQEFHEEDEPIDWEFWSSVVTNYANVARHQSTELSRAIVKGFPKQLRGLVWQLIASSKSSALEEVYRSILQEQSPHEKAIKRDLSRTSFIKNANSDSLFKIIKGYSLFDPEVGYTQGMAFIAVPLLINMSESEAFCLLVHIMKDYGFRSMFLPEMPGLHLRLYQFDRLIEDTLPNVHVHLSRQGVRSSMYASQWFLTLFAYKFPLQIVMRIYDIVIAEGIEAILRFGVALVKKNADTILSLEFDAVLTFLKEKIFDYYVADSGFVSGDAQYQVNELVSDAYDIKILPVTLRKFENEYTELHRLERERIEEVEGLRQSNGQLTLQVRRLETNLAALNKEHIEVANEMVQGRLEVARLQDENEQTANELADLKDATNDQSKLADYELRAKVCVVGDI